MTDAEFDGPEQEAAALRRWADEVDPDFQPLGWLPPHLQPAVRFGEPAWFDAVDERYGRPARVEELFPGHHPGRPFASIPTDLGPRLKGRAVRVERHGFTDEEMLTLPLDALRRTLARAADDLARRLFADTPLALATIVRTGIVPWDIEYQTTTDRATLERVTRLVEYGRGERRG